jgi:hypothetical protein
MYGRIHELLLHRNPRLFGEGDAARIDDLHKDDCVNLPTPTPSSA